MRDVYLLLWIYPKDKRIASDLKKHSFDDVDLTDYLMFLFERSNKKILELKNKLEKNRIGFITIKDTSYPKRLLQSPYSPLIFAYIGDFDHYTNSQPVAIIGSRRIDPELEDWLYRSFREKCDKYIYLSGGAIGTDQAIHKASLINDNKTLFVLPSGILNPYPSSLYKNFKHHKNSLFISHFPPEKKIFKSNFYSRNHLMASLCESLIVLQAEEKSGTLVTAKYALDMAKDIYVLSSSPWNKRYSGNIKLLEEGATQITNLDLFQ